MISTSHVKTLTDISLRNIFQRLHYIPFTLFFSPFPSILSVLVVFFHLRGWLYHKTTRLIVKESTVLSTSIFHHNEHLHVLTSYWSLNVLSKKIDFEFKYRIYIMWTRIFDTFVSVFRGRIWDAMCFTGRSYSLCNRNL